MTGHTPGPWQARRGQLWRGWVVCDESGAVHTTVSAEKAPETEANARLMAAAPELLKAAKAAHRALLTDEPYPHKENEALRQAIAKAEGRS